MGIVGILIEVVCFCCLIGLDLLRVGDKVFFLDFEEFVFLEIVDCFKIILLRVFGIVEYLGLNLFYCM